MISRLGAYCSRVSDRIVPDPFVFALVLTLVTMLLGLSLTPSSVGEMLGHWMNGFWDLLAFSMQMTLILVTGGVLAQAPPVQRMLNKAASWPRDTAQATMLVAFFAMASALVNWGLGLVVGALLAREVGRSLKARAIPHHYPLIGAAGYAGLMIWEGGLSGSAPLTVATPGHFLEDVTGVIPVTQTLFGPGNMLITVSVFVAAAFCLRAMVPRDLESWVGLVSTESDATEVPTSEPPRTIARRLNESVFLSLAICIPALAFLVHHFWRNGLAGLDLNTMNAGFLFLGFFLFLRPTKYVQAVSGAVSGASGIILQFPFYAGIMGMMRDSGLVGVFSDALVSLSGPNTFFPLAFLSGGIVNLFVPSGGGQWAVQGPILIDAAQRLGEAAPVTVMALAYGDQWTNMLQPFWALPLLSITGLQARQIIGYTAAMMILVGPLFIIGLMMS